MKLILKRYFVPNIVSLSSILAGFISIVMAGYGEIRFAASMIILGALFDSLDGVLARGLKAMSQLGKEIDSLSDVITFGVAPGYLLYHATLYKFGNLGILVSALLPIFAALRLARFNVKPTYRYFEGLPSTFAGLSIALLQGYYIHYFSPLFYLIFALALSMLMISKLKYLKPGLNKIVPFTRKNAFITLIILLSLLFFFKWTILFFVFLYLLSGIFNSIIFNKKMDYIKINS